MQKYTSACTSINSTKMPSIYKKLKWENLINCNVLDYGGGKYDNAKDWVKNTFGIDVFIYDPYNRSQEHNKEVLSHDFDYAILSNVLNVIAEKEERIKVLKHIKSLISEHLFISIYEGDKSGALKVNVQKCSCQLNRKLSDYVDEIKEVFDNVYIYKGIIEAF